ncbi:hypothetical protein [Thalassoroseus pseudoceratinae]|uniref:hypothetical protein n=1 Tax=Thalassoroseus pseudoceratinae TaxID=2713176 RepID=UPI001422FE25|nr:hypothetical protein [Thalassoroseus pseudoceratinae]
MKISLQFLVGKSHRSAFMLLLFVVSIGGLSGCGVESDLHGRWFNGEMSIRFLPNGHVLMNSRVTGLVRGVYVYERIPASAAASTNLRPNLQLYFADRQMNLQAVHIGSQRLSVTEVHTNSQRDPLRSKYILKKAPPEDERSMRLEQRRSLASASRDNP